MTFLCFLWKFYLNVSGLVKYVPGERPVFYHYWKSFKGFSKHEIQSNDEKCLLWFIIASLHPVQLRNNQFRVSKCQGYGHELNKSGIKYFVDTKAIGNLNIKTALVLMSIGTKINKNLPVTYYYCDHCKISRKFIIYHCWQNISLCIGERLEQTGIETI